MKKSDAKFALIAYVARSVGEISVLGKKALQKVVHLASEISGADFGYEFRLYTYGPFSRELASDVDVMDSIGLVAVNFNPTRNGYEISAKPEASTLIEVFIEEYPEEKENIDKIISIFGNRLAKDLELSSMLTFILTRKLVTDTSDDDSVVSKFLEIKPHYRELDVKNGLKEIRELLN